jgi:hypothetical protein
MQTAWNDMHSLGLYSLYTRVSNCYKKSNKNNTVSKSLFKVEEIGSGEIFGGSLRLGCEI